VAAGRAHRYEERERTGQTLVGKKLQLKVHREWIAPQPLILSEARAMRDWRKVQKEKKLLSSFTKDASQRQGHQPGRFGAFVTWRGRMVWCTCRNCPGSASRTPREILKVGQEVEVEVLNVGDHDRKRIGLSLKRLETRPVGPD